MSPSKEECILALLATGDRSSLGKDIQRMYQRWVLFVPGHLQKLNSHVASQLNGSRMPLYDSLNKAFMYWDTCQNSAGAPGWNLDQNSINMVTGEMESELRQLMGVTEIIWRSFAKKLSTENVSASKDPKPSAENLDKSKSMKLSAEQVSASKGMKPSAENVDVSKSLKLSAEDVLASKALKLSAEKVCGSKTAKLSAEKVCVSTVQARNPRGRGSSSSSARHCREDEAVGHQMAAEKNVNNMALKGNAMPTVKRNSGGVKNVRSSETSAMSHKNESVNDDEEDFEEENKAEQKGVALKRSEFKMNIDVSALKQVGSKNCEKDVNPIKNVATNLIRGRSKNAENIEAGNWETFSDEQPGDVKMRSLEEIVHKSLQLEDIVWSKGSERK